MKQTILISIAAAAALALALENLRLNAAQAELDAARTSREAQERISQFLHGERAHIDERDLQHATPGQREILNLSLD